MERNPFIEKIISPCVTGHYYPNHGSPYLVFAFDENDMI